MNNLDKEITQARLTVRTDSYPMSIGEIVSMYEENEIEIRPAFQRLFRWNDEQKSNFIESIFLGIPIPSIFVAQRPDGVWDLVDGLQRVSTILSFMQKLKDDEGRLVSFEPKSTKFLPSLVNKKWESEDETQKIHHSLKLLFKRQKLVVNIIERESDDNTKFELFQRLNTGGAPLEPQEIRNCLLLMLNQKGFSFIKELSDYEPFKATLPISESKEEKSLYNEFVLRFFIQRHPSEENLSKYSDVHPYLDAETLRLFAPDSNFDYENERDIFRKTFDLLSAVLEDDSFKKYNTDKKKYQGAVSLPVFETISTGVSYCVQNKKTESIIKKMIEDKSKELVQIKEFKEIFTNRVRPIDRTNQMIKLAKDLFCED